MVLTLAVPSVVRWKASAFSHGSVMVSITYSVAREVAVNDFTRSVYASGEVPRPIYMSMLLSLCEKLYSRVTRYTPALANFSSGPMSHSSTVRLPVE